MKTACFGLNILILLFCFLQPIYGQEESGRTSLIPNISSPTAASLGKYGEIPVSLFTGSPSITVPIFELKGSKLSLPINLSYNASGVKVEEVPGWAGLGWSLNAGGVITRTVRGLPDDREKGYLVQGGDSAEVHLGGTSGPSVQYLEQIYFNNLDGEPDQYYFNFNGRAGNIFLARDENSDPFKYKAYSKSQKDILIKIQKDINSRITSWTITVEDGTKYIFDETEITTHYSGGQEVSYTSSWYLSRIESAKGNETVNLTYQVDEGISTSQSSAQSFDTLPNGWDGCTPSNYYATFSSYSVPKYLWTIETLRHKATFSRSSRTDNGGKRLTYIDIENKLSTTPNRRFELVHGYFNSSLSSINQRLRLDSIRQFSGTGSSVEELPSWNFIYDTSYSLPPRNSFSQDFWGYYNGAANQELPSKIQYNGTTYGTANREPNEDYLLAGVLTELHYPTGGKTNFTYEGHKYYDQETGTNTLGGGIRIKRIEHHDGMNSDNNIVINYQYTDNLGQSTGILLKDPKVYNIHQYSFQDYSNYPDFILDRNCHYMSRTSTSYVAPGMMQGSAIMYSKVKEIYGNEGEFGYTIKTFDIPNVLTYITQWPYTPTIVEGWRSGKVTAISKYDKFDNKLESTSFEYESTNEKFLKGVVVGARLTNNHSALENSESYDFTPTVYSINNGAYYLVKKKYSLFDVESAMSMTDSVEYIYENLPDQVQLTKMIESNNDGSKRITNYKYAHEVSNDGRGLNYLPMKSLNMLSQRYSVTTRDELGTVLKKNWTLWSNSSGWWRPESQWVWKGGDPTIPIFENQN